MPEASSDAMILITTSWQALNRVIQSDKETLICDCTVVILFAAFFVEANLNHIIDELDETEEMLDFLYGQKRRGDKYPGLQDKLGWFYNQYIEKSKAVTKVQMRENGITGKLIDMFPGFDKIYQFRNDVSHGNINLALANRTDAEKLRQQAKNIVNQLFEIAFTKADRDIPRVITYQAAISK